jgi:iron(III) transport system substrate-binding protein
MTTESDGQPAEEHGGPRRPGSVLPLAVVAVLLAACGGTDAGAGQSEADAEAETVTLYTCLSDESIQPVIAAFEDGAPGTRVELFRAPTGELNARVAADVRSGGLQADVFWGCDPLTVQSLVDQDLVGGWTPPEAEDIPAEFRTDDYVGAHLLYMVAVHRTDVPAPEAWTDLTGPAYTGAVAVPDPSVAASALGTLGFFAEEPGFGVDFYRDLQANGAVQVGTPDEVTTGVAQGIYGAGLTTANSAYAAESDGSPVAVAWPEPGAVAIYGPVALATDSADSQGAKDFISFVTGADGQTVLGESGAYPTLPDAPGPTIPDGAPVVSPDWAAIAGNRAAILAEYQQVFGG